VSPGIAGAPVVVGGGAGLVVVVVVGATVVVVTARRGRVVGGTLARPAEDDEHAMHASTAPIAATLRHRPDPTPLHACRSTRAIGGPRRRRGTPVVAPRNAGRKGA
jgi:hypothetical protein